MSQSTKRNLKRMRALLLTIGLVVATNFAISYADGSEKSGVPLVGGNMPRPKSGVPLVGGNMPRPKSGVPLVGGNMPRPKSGVPLVGGNMPRP
jgi:hypothetical protein